MTAFNVDLSLIQKYNVNGPRYTSYPTALQFHDLSPDDYLQAVENSPIRHKDLSLYFHIPFCSTLCYYCACSKIVTRDTSKATQYLGLLEKEVQLQASHFEARKVSQLHWGGGTPTFFPDDEIRKLMSCIRSHFELRSDDRGEFGIEIDPRTVDRDRVHLLREVGFNRLSLGIQDFDARVQKAVNRIQSVEDTRKVVEAARDAAFKSISVDLIYGLPFQTTDSIAATLDEVIRISPDRISIYNYAHLPDRFTPQRRINLVDLPSANNKLRILKLCIETLNHAGYRYIGMDHFAKPTDELSIAQQNGSLHRNFQGYSTFAECDLVAMGITGIGLVGNCYAQNVKTMDEYQVLIGAGKLAIQRGIVIDRDDLIRKAVIMALICQFVLDIGAIESEFGIDFSCYFSNELEDLESMAEDGLLSTSRESIRVTDKGRLLIRNICMIFDAHLKTAEGTRRYSRAI